MHTDIVIKKEYISNKNLNHLSSEIFTRFQSSDGENELGCLSQVKFAI